MSSSCSLAGGVRRFFGSTGPMTNRPMVLPKDIRIPQRLVHDFLSGHSELLLDLAKFIADLGITGLRPLHSLLPVLKYQNEPVPFRLCVVHSAFFLRDGHDTWMRAVSRVQKTFVNEISGVYHLS